MRTIAGNGIWERRVPAGEGAGVPAGSGVPAASSSRPPPEKRRKFDAFGTPRSLKAGLGSRVNV